MIENINQTNSLASFADHMTDIVWKVDQDGLIRYANRHWQEFSGTAAPEKSESVLKLINFIHLEDAPKLELLWQTSLNSHSELSLEVRLLCTKSATYVWHLLRAWPVLSDDKTGEILHWMVICTDVHALKTTQTMFQLVMDNIPISIFWKDRNSVYLGCNKSFAIDMGVQSTEDMIGRNDYDNDSTKEQSDFFVQVDRRVMESNTPEYHIIEPQQRHGGQQCWVDTNKIPLRDAGGSVFGVLGMYEDITKRVILEQQREDFVATLTHDLKNPLLGTNRVLDLLVNGKLGTLSESQKQLLNQLKESNGSLLSLVQNLTDVYKHDTVAVLSDVQEVDFEQFLNECVGRHQVVADIHEITLTFVMLNKSRLLKFNKQAMSRVLQNLIDNALKFVPQNGQVEVTASISTSHYSFEIKDNGPGIEPEEQKLLFRRYSQGVIGKSFSAGSGLGLYLCKQIVEAHKGTITCKSTPGGGTSFTVLLPINLDSQTVLSSKPAGRGT